MKFKIFYILFLILLSASVIADDGPLYIQSVDCKEDGSATLSFGTLTAGKIYTTDINVKAEYIGEEVVGKPKFDVAGNWNYNFIKETSSDRTILLTNEVLFNLTGEYKLTAEYEFKNTSYIYNTRMNCPGFEFSCRLLGVYINSCKNIYNKYFEADVKIYGLGDITSENLSLENNIDFLVDAEEKYEDIKGEFSLKGGLPKVTKIENPSYGQYYFNITNFDNKIRSFVVKFVNINYISGGCVNYPNISLYNYRECENVFIEEKKVEESKNETKGEINSSIIVGEVIKEMEIDLSTKRTEENKKPLIILFIIFGLCILGVIYIVLKRNFNKGSDF